MELLRHPLGNASPLVEGLHLTTYNLEVQVLACRVIVARTHRMLPSLLRPPALVLIALRRRDNLLRPHVHYLFGCI